MAAASGARGGRNSISRMGPPDAQASGHTVSFVSLPEADIAFEEESIRQGLGRESAAAVDRPIVPADEIRTREIDAFQAEERISRSSSPLHAASFAQLDGPSPVSLSAAAQAGEPSEAADAPALASGGLDAVLASKLAAADRELCLAQSAASRLAAANHRLVAAQAPVIITGTASSSSPTPPTMANGSIEGGSEFGERGERSEDYDAKLAVKMREIEVLQRRTEENISRLTSSRSLSASQANLLGVITPNYESGSGVEAAQFTLDGLGQELHVVSGQLAAQANAFTVSDALGPSTRDVFISTAGTLCAEELRCCDTVPLRD